MVSKLSIGNGIIMNPEDKTYEEEEKNIMHLYNNPEPLREKFRSQVLETLLSIELARAEYEYEYYKKFRKHLFPYLPPYDITDE